MIIIDYFRNLLSIGKIMNLCLSAILALKLLFLQIFLNQKLAFACSYACRGADRKPLFVVLIATET